MTVLVLPKLNVAGWSGINSCYEVGARGYRPLKHGVYLERFPGSSTPRVEKDGLTSQMPHQIARSASLPSLTPRCPGGNQTTDLRRFHH